MYFASISGKPSKVHQLVREDSDLTIGMLVDSAAAKCFLVAMKKSVPELHRIGPKELLLSYKCHFQLNGEGYEYGK